MSEKKRYTVTLQFSFIHGTPVDAIREAEMVVNGVMQYYGSTVRILAIHSSGIGIASLEPPVLVYGTDFTEVKPTEDE